MLPKSLTSFFLSYFLELDLKTHVFEIFLQRLHSENTFLTIEKNGTQKTSKYLP